MICRACKQNSLPWLKYLLFGDTICNNCWQVCLNRWKRMDNDDDDDDYTSYAPWVSDPWVSTVTEVKVKKPRKWLLTRGSRNFFRF